jgi:hypothetical protein
LPGSFLSSPESHQDSISEANQSLWAISEKIGDVDERCGLLVFFPASIPGCGKSTLLGPDTSLKLGEAVAVIARSQKGTKTRKVPVMSGDQHNKRVKFWQAVFEVRLKDHPSITLADKNVPKSTWDKVAQICASSNGRAIPVLPDNFNVLQTTHVDGSRTPDLPSRVLDGKHHYPFSLAYLAPCGLYGSSTEPERREPPRET